MSALHEDEVLKPILLRSATPAPNEKVMKYLHGMHTAGDEVERAPPRSMLDPNEYRSRAGSSRNGSQGIYTPASRVLRGDMLLCMAEGEDADSNIQEGLRSEVGDTSFPAREPGPNDPPGPKYESYDSSFGNFGPMPRMTIHPISGWNNPPKPSSEIPWNINTDLGSNANAHPTRVPLPASEMASPRTHSVTIGRGGESPPKFIAQHSKSPSRGSVKPLTKGTVYPPLPESRAGDDNTNFDGLSSPRAKSQVRSKAASISPSDSPSQAKHYSPSKTPSRQEPSNYYKSEPPGSLMSGSHQSRPFSPYRHAATHEDLLYAAVRGRAYAIPEEDEKQSTVTASQHGKPASAVPSRLSKAPSGGAKTASQLSHGKQSSIASSKHGQTQDGDVTPRPRSPADELALDAEEARIVQEALASQTPRTSYYAASALEPEVANHFHDMELCLLLHQENDPSVHEVVKKAIRKAVRQRVKKLGMKYDNESIRQYRKSHHDHDPSVHLHAVDYPNDDPPTWVSDIKREIVLMQQRIESLGPKIEALSPNRSYGDSRFGRDNYDGDDYTRTPMTQTVNIQTQRGTLADSMYQPPETEVRVEGTDGQDEYQYEDTTEKQIHGLPRTDGETQTANRSNYAMSDNRDDSGGQDCLEEQFYQLRQKPQGSQSQVTHRSWELALDDEQNQEGPTAPTIPDTNGGAYPDRTESPPLPALPDDGNGELVPTPQQNWNPADYGQEGQQLPPWQRIHQRLLSWAIIWPSSELDHALNSTSRGRQVDEVALSIWSTQTYKRYVRARLTDSPQGVVDRLFVPPNMADAISTAVFNGRHGDACGMLRDLWNPFALEGMPRLLIVLAKHRSEDNHWVVHRFSLPEGTLTTYDSYHERTLPDGRPLGWWFAIRVAWPNAIYPSPEKLVQKMVRLHRPMQLPIDNSVAAAGIWRNLLMGSRAERSLDLERLRDLINTEVKNLRQRKQLGKLSIGAPRPTWEDMAA
ncbi:hypothetical protein BD779DRAFT_1435825 [Infundibulicybe gibba]|nr:hypothetical protein BD779DRAFT_1435825 [Infundibulicybe gibba]